MRSNCISGLVLLSLLTRNLHLSRMTRSICAIQVLLADELFSGPFVVGNVNFLESIERELMASLGRNLPMTDSDFMIAKVIVFGQADIVACRNVSSQRACSLKQSGPFLIDGYSVALVVAISNANASLRTAEFDGLD